MRRSVLRCTQNKVTQTPGTKVTILELAILPVIKPSAISVAGTTNRHSQLQLAAVFSLLAGIHLLSLLRLPAAFEDEGWYANRAWGLLHSGWAYGTADSGVFENYPHYERFFFWLGSALTAPFLVLFGPTLFAVRLVSLLAGMILLAVIYYIAVRLYDHYTGLLAVGLLGMSVPFFQMAHYGRQDIIVAAFGYGAVACYLSAAHSGRYWKGFLAGLLATLTLDIHPSGAIFIAAIGLLCLRDYGRRAIRTTRCWTVGAGIVAGTVYFVALHILPDPQVFSTLYKLTFGDFRMPPLQTGDPLIWLTSLKDTLSGLDIPVGEPLRAQSILGGLIAAATIGVLWRRTDADRTILTLLGGLILAFALLIQFKQLFYYISLLPAAVVISAAWVAWLMRLPWRGSLRGYSRLVLLWGLVFVAVSIVLPALLGDGNPNYETSLAAVRQAIPATSTVMGNQLYWLAQPKQRYLSWEQLIYYQRYRPGSSLAEAFEYLRPDYLIFDGSLSVYVKPDKSQLDLYTQTLYISKPELTRVLAERAQLVATVPAITFGTIQIYQLNWK